MNWLFCVHCSLYLGVACIISATLTVQSGDDGEAAAAASLKALRVLRVLAPYLEEWTHFLSSVLLHALSESNNTLVRAEAIRTVDHACRHVSFGGSITAVAVALTACLHRDDLRAAASECMAAVAQQLGRDFVVYGHAQRVNTLFYQYGIYPEAYEKVGICI